MRGGGPSSCVRSGCLWTVPPGARGWSPVLRRLDHPAGGSPGCAGVVPWSCAGQVARKGFPRVRGGGPFSGGVQRLVGMVPPGARGWSQQVGRSRSAATGSPGCAGVVPIPAGRRARTARFPRVRGGGPFTGYALKTILGVPPGARGWSPQDLEGTKDGDGSPGCAGVVPGNFSVATSFGWFPRVRGGGPLKVWKERRAGWVPPGARGWSRVSWKRGKCSPGSPGCAGVVPGSDCRRPSPSRFPRVRGGGPLGA